MVPPEQGGPLSLPYAFDTNATGRLIVKGLVGIEAALLVVGAVKLATDLSASSVLLVLFTGTVIAVPGILVFVKLGGASGRIAAEGVTVEPGTFLAFRTSAPAGTFALDRFGSVRVEEASSTTGQPREYQRVYLAGKSGTPDILIARTEGQRGRRLGIALGTLLHLPVEEKRMAY